MIGINGKALAPVASVDHVGSQRSPQQPYARTFERRLELGIPIFADDREARFLVRALGRIVADEHANLCVCRAALPTTVKDCLKHLADEAQAAECRPDRDGFHDPRARNPIDRHVGV